MDEPMQGLALIERKLGKGNDAALFCDGRH
jgi:hypothetical protein